MIYCCLYHHSAHFFFFFQNSCCTAAGGRRETEGERETDGGERETDSNILPSIKHKKPLIRIREKATRNSFAFDSSCAFNLQFKNKRSWQQKLYLENIPSQPLQMVKTTMHNDNGEMFAVDVIGSRQKSHTQQECTAGAYF